MAIVIYNTPPQDWRPDSALSPEELKKRNEMVARFRPFLAQPEGAVVDETEDGLSHA